MHRILFVSFALFIGPWLHAQDSTAAPKENFTYSDALVLGLIQGVTEFLPISSTGHLILANNILQLDTDQPLFDKSGALIIKVPATDDSDAQVYTLKDAAYAYNVVLNAGTILVICILYWRYILSMISGLLGRNANGLLLLRNLTIAFVPAGLVGFFFHNMINEYFYSPKMVAIALILGSFVMLSAERWRQTRSRIITNGDGPRLHELTARRSLCIGCLQILAMWPGTSRSMMTIVGGYFVGFSPRHAAEFSFLLGCITALVASLYKIYKEGTEMMQILYWEPMLLGCIVALISGLLTIRAFIYLLVRYGLAPFAWYRIALAALTLATII